MSVLSLFRHQSAAPRPDTSFPTSRPGPGPCAMICAEPVPHGPAAAGEDSGHGTTLTIGAPTSRSAGSCVALLSLSTIGRAHPWSERQHAVDRSLEWHDSGANLSPPRTTPESLTLNARLTPYSREPRVRHGCRGPTSRQLQRLRKFGHHQ